MHTAKPVLVRVFSPLGLYPRHPIEIPGARLLVSDELIVSAIHVEPPEAHGLVHSFKLNFLRLEETRFLAAIALAVHPDDGMAFTYPLYGYVDVDSGLDDDALIEAAQQLAARISGWWGRSAVLPPESGGPPYQWREGGVNVDRVLNIVSTVRLNDHLLMRGLGALLQADMCWRHREIEGVAVLLEPTKTKLVEFGRFAQQQASRRKADGPGPRRLRRSSRRHGGEQAFRQTSR